MKDMIKQHAAGAVFRDAPQSGGEDLENDNEYFIRSCRHSGLSATNQPK